MPRAPTPPAPATATATAAAPAAAPARTLSAPAKALQKLGLTHPVALALHLPLRYEDETRLTPLAEVRPGETAQVEGTVRECKVELRPRRQLVVKLQDDAGDELVLRFVNFYPSHQKTLAVGQQVRVRGEVRHGFFGREMVHPSFKAVVEGAPLADTLTPVYPASAQLPQSYLRKAVAAGLQRANLHEVIPPELVPPGLPLLRDALEVLHHPPPRTPLAALEERTHPAWQRLKFEELLAQQLSQWQARLERAARRAPQLLDSPLPLQAADPAALAETPAQAQRLSQRLLAVLPFGLTAAQQRVVAEITADLGRAQPMHRLLQGDVGAGKTVVAALAATEAMGSGWQCALMAPTEILAEQHFAKLVQWLEPLGITVAWLSGSRKGKARQAHLDAIASGQALLVVGTHAVIQSDVKFARLGLAIVDEQHRFGVAQRLALRQHLSAPAHAANEPGETHGNALEPHLLMMTATPIPRTLAMTHFADLDVSTIDELPPGRTPILTKVFTDARRDDVVARVAEEIERGRQAYWVCPLIEESETLDLQNAQATHEALAAALPQVKVGLLHGRLPAADKAAVMAEFKEGRMGLLVATTVIEVGVDVPNASLMVIEHAERFGLAQLHQLRGRVGRGAAASVCVLLHTPPLSVSGKARLKAMIETTDGFEIARRDLEIRGPGEFLGERQSGDALLRFADLHEDEALVQRAQAAAKLMWERHPHAAMAQVRRWHGGHLDYLQA